MSDTTDTVEWTEVGAVARGAAWLDVEAPGWAARVDLDSLNLTSGFLCVAGQALAELRGDSGMSGYAIMNERAVAQGLGVTNISQDVDRRVDVRLGFTHQDLDVYVSGTGPKLDALKAAWLVEINSRVRRDAIKSGGAVSTVESN